MNIIKSGEIGFRVAYIKANWIERFFINRKIAKRKIETGLFKTNLFLLYSDLGQYSITPRTFKNFYHENFVSRKSEIDSQVGFSIGK